MWNDTLLDSVVNIALAAGQEILAVYNQAGDIVVSTKADDSPLTEADRRAHTLIVEQLITLDDQIPVLSEESESISSKERNSWERYWLVDPLDGTKEFVKRNGEFTVNIALIEKGQATLGVVHVPVLDTTYVGKLGLGAWKSSKAGIKQIKCSSIESPTQLIRVVASRSHRGELVDDLLQLIKERFGETEVVSMGSSLKICLLAEGAADIYPRLAPTCEWDTAAAHAVVSAAGGEIVDTNFQTLRYNQKEELLNPHFIGIADVKYDWESLLDTSN
jgi:3'(2'), 5'-bisphosphate nucleotidase